MTLSIGMRATVLFHSGSIEATVLDERPAERPIVYRGDGAIVDREREAEIDLRVEG